MAFMGIFLVGILLWIVVIAIICMILAIFIPCLIISIINLVKGIKNNWPKRNIIPLAITGSIVILFMALFLIIVIKSAVTRDASYDSSNTDAMISTLQFLLRL